MRKYDKYIQTLKAMGLTSRSLNLAVTGALFECLHLLAHSPESWTKMRKVQQHCRVAENVKLLIIYRDFFLQSDFHDRLDLTSIPNLVFFVYFTEANIVTLRFFPNLLLA